MAQPSQRLLLKLPHPFAAEAQLLPQLLQRARRLLSQTIPADDHLTKTLRKLTDQNVQDAFGEFPLYFLSRVWYGPRCWYLLQPDIGVSAQFLGPPMNLTTNSHPCVSGKGAPTRARS